MTNRCTHVWLTSWGLGRHRSRLRGNGSGRSRTARHLTRAALAKAVQALGYNWLQTTVAKTEAAERPLRLNEATALAGVLGIETEYLLLSPPLTGLLDVSQGIFGKCGGCKRSLGSWTQSCRCCRKVHAEAGGSLSGPPAIRRSIGTDACGRD